MAISALTPFLLRTGGTLVAVYLVLMLMMFFLQKNYIYFPTQQDFDACPGFANSQKINHKGTRAYYTKTSDKLLVFYHGNAGSACDRAIFHDTFRQLGYSTVFVEYAGYSNDPRQPDRTLLLQDAEHINEFIAALDYSELVLAGESLGAAVAAYHSSLVPQSRLLLISPFDRLLNIAKHHYPYLPVSLLLREDYNAAVWLSGNIKSAAVIHGQKDKIIPIKYGRALFEKIPVAEKYFFEIPEAGHNDLFNFPEAFEAIMDYLKKADAVIARKN